MGIRSQGQSIYQTLKNINYSEELVTGVMIGGIIGGLLFSIISPIVVPPLQDRVIGAGFGPNPSPELVMQYNDETDDSRIQDSVNISVNESEYQVYYATIRNPTNKLMTDVNVMFMYDGCVISSDIHGTSLDSAMVSPTSDSLQMNRVLGDCVEEMTIDELPPGRWATVYMVVDKSQINEQVRHDFGHQEVALHGNYGWQYNGRMYYSQIQTSRTVTDRLESGDRLN